MTRRVMFVLMVLLAAVTVRGQNPAPEAPPPPAPKAPSQATFRGTADPERPPTFRTQVEAVAIDVFVTDAAGNPVTGLTADDFELDEDGKKQDITTFQAVNIPVGTRSTDFPPAEPDVASNDQPEGRIYVMAFAGGDPCKALRARADLRRFLDTRFGPNDLAAVVNLREGLSTDGQDFTGNRRLLQQAIDKLTGDFGIGCSAADGHIKNELSPDDRRGTTLVKSLRDVIEVLGRMPGRHKSLLYFNEGPGYPWGDLVDYEGGVGSLTFGTDPITRQSVRGINSTIFDDAHAAMTIATRNNLTIYPIDPGGLEGAIGGSMSIDQRMDFRAMAEITGGFAHTHSNDIDGAFERIVRDASTYYMLGFNSDYRKNDGKFVRLNVRVKRQGLMVRARTGYVNANQNEYAAAAKARVERGPVVTALANPVASSGHQLRVTVAPFKGANGKATVVLTVETALGPSARQPRADQRSGAVEIRYLATDAKRQIYPEFRHTTTLSLPVQQADATGDRVRLVSEMDLPAGRFQIRVAGAANRVGGGVIYDLEVPDFSSGSLMMSGLTLATAGSNLLPTVAPVTDKKKVKTRRCDTGECVSADVREVPLVAFAPASLAPTHPLHSALPAPPTTVREFRQSETVSVFSEVYDNKGGRAVQVRAELRQPDQPAAISVSGDLMTDKPRASGGHGVTVNLPLATVPPGSYVLHVEARAASGNEVASRQIPVRIR